MDNVTRLQQQCEGFFGELLGIRIKEAEPERILAELHVRDDLRTVPGVMHGGAIMGFADALGGLATGLNLAPGFGTTTIESKTNFFAPATAGTTITAECVALHRGRRTHVWQTTIRGANGRVCAIVTQTQIVLEPQLGPQEQMAALFAGKGPAEQKALLAQLERGGAAVYRSLAAKETDPGMKAALLAAAAREIENAETLEQPPPPSGR
jgi:uncharacterized protein (TIGR00369 family)